MSQYIILKFFFSANGQQVTVIQPSPNMTNVGGLANLGNLTQVRPNVFQVCNFVFLSVTYKQIVTKLFRNEK